MESRTLSTQEISDRIQINDLLIRYTRAIDTKDFELLDTCFLPDALVDYSESAGAAAKGAYPEVRAWLQKALAPFATMMHFIGNTTIELDGDEAKSRTYVINPMGFQNPDGSLQMFTVGAHYVDKLVRTSDGWRIAERYEQQCYLDGSLPEAMTIPT